MFFSFDETIAGRSLVLETGRMAKQADGAVFVRYGDSAVLVATVSEKRSTRDLGFFPLTVEYRERTYAAGKIPGGFFKREGRPGEKEVLSARLIDRPLRPLFPDGYRFETQVYCLVVSSDGENDPDLLGLIGASAALMVSDIPWDGPVSAVRIGMVDGKLVVNPTVPQLDGSALDLVVAVRGDDVVMLEGGAVEVDDDILLRAIALGSAEARKINELQLRLAGEAGRHKRSFEPPQLPDGLLDDARGIVSAAFDGFYGRGTKDIYAAAMTDALEKATQTLAQKYAEGLSDDEWAGLAARAVERAEAVEVRSRLFSDGVRMDGRKTGEIRPITCEVGVLPRAHGSALFTRGQTQALVAATLGGERDTQRIDALTGEYMKDYMLHYNFPSFSVGEVSPARGPGRREIGHGALSERAIRAVMPGEEFFYTVRVVSDILESNGSSSMATVCGGSLCLMDAGVPIRRAVAGVALGLFVEDGEHRILSDIAGAEDHLGDMDLKIAGTTEGVTAVQMDLKVSGVSEDILREAFEQAREGRERIIGVMSQTISVPRPELSPHAPRCIAIRIPTEKIGKLIGPGGKTIRGITEETGVQIDVQDDGRVTILSTDSVAAQRALEIVESIAGEAKIGAVYNGTVRKIMNFGAFVEIMPGTDGLLHISEISHERIREVEDVMKEGDRVRVRVIAVRPDGKINLTMKDVDQE
ncbi:polyribonucleotide nucleotidyltransferase [Candidatus Fermentibacterales bacterium]|nr:polyribonucleotide nucleotidyltransferase [Candidatus Fermentibacterales bacterium]